MKPRGLLLVVALLGGVAGAETAPNLTDRQPPPMRLRDLARESGSSIVGNMGQSKPKNIIGEFRRAAPKAGKYIKWGGNILFAASLVNDALNWFYNSANNAINPVLDKWWRGIPDAFPEPMAVSNIIPDETMCYGYQDNNPRTYYIAKRTNTDGTFLYNLRYAYFSTTGETIQTSYNSGIRDRNQVVVIANQQCALLRPYEPPTLSELDRTTPGGIGSTIGQIVARYVEANPDATRPYFESTPNDNQWTDNPYTNPNLDTDGDGFSDPDEFEDPQGDPNDPLKKPLGVPYETGRSTVTTTNPDGSTTTTTTISYSDGSTATTKVTRRTTSSTNPDGSITTTTTTTTTTTDREGRTTSRTHTDTKTSPKPDGTPNPGPDPDPDGDHDQDGIPNKDDPDRIRERQQQAEGEARQKAEEEAKRKAEEEAKKKEEEEAKKKEEEEAAKKKKEEELAKKKEKCEAAERVWDDVNDTCGGEKPKDEDGDGVDNDCGDFSVPRLLKHTGAYLKDVVFPCEKPEDILKPILDALQHKFPFSLAASLNGWFDGASSAAGGDSSSTLPATLGIIPLDWGWLTPLWVIIKNVVGVALWVWFVYWLVDRFAPRTQI